MCGDSGAVAASTSAEPAQSTQPAVTVEQFDEIFEQLKRWGQYSEPSRGAWSTVGPDKVREAAGLVRSGRTAQMALPWNTVSGIDNPQPAMHMMVELGDREPPEPTCNKDFLGVAFHGKAVSHLDALSHIAYRGQLFDGNTSAEVVNATGTDFGEHYFVTTPRLESGDPRYTWVNQTIFVGQGRIQPGPVVEFQVFRVVS